MDSASSPQVPESLIRLFSSPPAQASLHKAWPVLQREGWSRATARTLLRDLHKNPTNYADHPALSELAKLLQQESVGFHQPEVLQPWLDRSPTQRGLPEAQRLPISVYGAVLPGRQAGFGLPVGGVLATRDAVIPRAVGRDIGCRVHLSLFPKGSLRMERPAARSRLKELAQTHLRFGLEARQPGPIDDPIFDDPDWETLPLLSRFRDRARQRLGTSGTGNHFVDFGTVRMQGESPALLTHHGSRGLGEEITNHFHRLARRQCDPLPRELRDWAWLELKSEEGQQYWTAMELCLRYTEASHRWLHTTLANVLGLEVSQSHSWPHNFASREVWREREVIVHRKGAIRLGPEQVGVICGSQIADTLLVKGTACDSALHSASHGLGREMARSTARRVYRRRHTEDLFEEAGVEVVHHQPDEWPGIYRSVEQSVEGHAGLLEVVGTFTPRLVWMCGGNDPSED